MLNGQVCLYKLPVHSIQKQNPLFLYPFIPLITLIRIENLQRISSIPSKF